MYSFVASGVVGQMRVARSLVTGAPIEAGGVMWSTFEGAILAAPTAAVGTVPTGAAFEAGLLVGSFVDAAVFDPCTRLR
jgi:hypothetical protein